jgi:aubergine-like protein
MHRQEGYRGGARGGSRGGSNESRGGGSHRGGGRGRGGENRGSNSRPVSAQSHTIVTPKPYENTKINTVPSAAVKTKSLVDQDDIICTTTKPGTLGKRMTVVSNYFPVELKTDPFYMYDVEFEVEERSKRICNAVIGKLLKDKYVYDGQKTLFLREQVEDFSGQVELYGKSFHVKVQFTKRIDSSKIGMPVVQLYNILYRSSFRHLKLASIGRNYFDLSKRFKIGEDLEIAPGQQQTLYKTKLGLVANRDIAWKILRTESYLTIFHRLMEQYKGADLQKKFEQEVANKIAFLPHLNRTVYITGVNWKLNPLSLFQKDEKTKVSFKDYNRERYRVNITDMGQPMLEQKKESGTSYYIPEMCHPTGLTDEMRADFRIMKDMVNATGLNPNDRFKSIVHTMRENNTNQSYVKSLEENGYQMKDTPIEVPARQLPTPQVIFGSQVQEKPDTKYGWNMNNKSLLREVSLTNWALVYPNMSRIPDDNPNHEINIMLDVFKRVSTGFGMKVDEPEYIPTKQNVDDYERAITGACELGKKFVVIVLPRKSTPHYNKVKDICSKNNLLSQCIVWNTIVARQGEDRNKLLNKVIKIAIQVATKLGGAPWTLDYELFKDTMIVGLDVHHSGEIGTKKKKSVVGFCSTLGGDQSEFYSTQVIQTAGQEIVKALGTCMEGALKAYKKRNTKFPAKVLFYRDGVGEGQVSEVKTVEIAAIRKALNSWCKEAKLVHIVVLKRINTRLGKWNKDNLDNLPPGSVVDTDIVSPNAMEFFLIAHSVTQGTATPTKYQCIENEANLDMDTLQMVTYQLCHSYYNWSNAIRVPAVCQNAHKLAFFVGQAKLKDVKFTETLHYL